MELKVLFLKEKCNINKSDHNRALNQWAYYYSKRLP